MWFVLGAESTQLLVGCRVYAKYGDRFLFIQCVTEEIKSQRSQSPHAVKYVSLSTNIINHSSY